MDGSSETAGDNVVISLSKKEGRDAKLACMKEKDGDEKYSHIREAEEEFSRAFDDGDESYYEDTCFMMSPRAASAAARATELNGPREVASKMRYQLTMQGVIFD